MRKPFRAGGAAVGAVAAALAAGAFAFTPASATVSTATGPRLPASIRPGTPMKAVGPGAAAVGAAAAATSVTNLQAANWAGYASSFGTTTFRYIAAQFKVPALNCTGVTAPNGAWSAHWVGLDGLRNATVEQVGLIAACSNSTTAVYAPFWEMAPNGPNTPSIAVKPGDTISVSVAYSRTTRKFTLTFSDTTTGQHFSRNPTCPAGVTCLRNSAEAISEPPFDPTTSTFLPLADFGTSHFTNVSITNTTGTHHGGLQSSFWNTFRITEVAETGINFTITGTPIAAGVVLDTPGSLSKQRNFTNQWASANATG